LAAAASSFKLPNELPKMEALGGGDSKQLGIFKDKGTGEVAGLLVYEGSPGSYGTPEEVQPASG